MPPHWSEAMDSMEFSNPQPFADFASQACQLAPALDTQVKSLSSRVQKLERSKGQMFKDLADMLSETRDLRKKVAGGAEDDRKQAALSKASSSDLFSPELEEPPEGGPPGLSRRLGRTKTAPPAAAALPRVPEEVEQSCLGFKSKTQTKKIPPPPGLAPPIADSLSVHVKEVDGVEVARVEWRVDNIKAKFKDCVGWPHVSQQFELGGLSELRLMVSPDLGLDVSGLTMREQKSRIEARIAEGPLGGVLKFKAVSNAAESLVIKFKLFVGNVYRGPFEHDFVDHIIHSADFKNNWLEQMRSGGLIVGVEVMTVQGSPPSVAAAAAKVVEVSR